MKRSLKKGSLKLPKKTSKTVEKRKKIIYN
jgi:hypothetical protein